MQLAGVTWRERPDGHFDRGLEVWVEEQDGLLFLPVNQNDKISWTFAGPRSCVGFRDPNGVPVRCPERSALRRGLTKCGPCNALDLTSQCVRCSGSECRAEPERRKQCDGTDYVVYLALFGTETVKVGVSSAARAKTRWAEQGADYGAQMAKVHGGMLARRLEHSLSRAASFAKAVRGERKMSGMLLTVDQDEAQASVEALLASNRITPSYMERYGVQQVEWPPKVVNMSQYYGLGRLGTSPQRLRFRDATKDTVTMVGEVVGMKGSIVVSQAGESLFMADLRQFIGYTMTSESHGGLVTQSALSEFI